MQACLVDFLSVQELMKTVFKMTSKIELFSIVLLKTKLANLHYLLNKINSNFKKRPS